MLGTSSLRRADSIKLYNFQNDSSIVELDFSLHSGDRIVVDGIPGSVQYVYEDTVFGEKQRVFYITGRSVSGDSTFNIKYSTKFGLLFNGRYFPNYSYYSMLDAAQLEGKKYGYPADYPDLDSMKCNTAYARKNIK